MQYRLHTLVGIITISVGVSYADHNTGAYEAGASREQVATPVASSAGKDAKHGSALSEQGMPDISDARVQEKKVILTRDATRSRWALRTVEIATLVGVGALWLYSVSRVSDEERIERLEASVAKHEKALSHMQTSSESSVTLHEHSQFSLRAWLPGIVPVVSSLVQQLAFFAVPHAIYQRLVQPVYVTDLSHYIQHHTAIDSVLRYLEIQAEYGIDAFVQARDCHIARLIEDVEQVLALICSAQEYLDPCVTHSLQHIYHAITGATRTFVLRAHAQDTQVVLQAIRQMRSMLYAEAQSYSYTVRRQPVMAYLTSL